MYLSLHREAFDGSQSRAVHQDNPQGEACGNGVLSLHCNSSQPSSKLKGGSCEPISDTHNLYSEQHVFKQEFHRQGAPQLYPDSQSAAIEEINAWVYDSVSNGAYKAGFSSTQLAYECAYEAFFEAIDRLELLLTRNR